MANTKISALTSATTPLAGTEVLPVVQSGTTTQVSVANLTAGRAVSAASLALTTTPLPVSSGGTGLTAFTLSSLPYASTTTTLANSNLYSNGTNVGLNNSAPYAWTTGNAVTVGTKAAFASDSTYGAMVASNVYYSAGWKIATTGSVAGGLLAVGNYGRLYFYGTSSGTAGNASTLTQYMFIDGFNGGTTTFGPTSGAVQDMYVNISNTNFYSYLNFQRNGTTFANILGYYGTGVYYNADAHYFRTYAGTTLISIDSSGNTTLNAGNLVQGTAAKGINFTANTPAAGMTSQLLNWYEDGTWTPNQGAGLTLVGAFSSTGKYTRIGRQVSISGTVTGATSVAVTAAGVITSNLPFTVGTAGHGDATNAAVTASATVICTGTSVTSATAIAATGTVTFSATYFV